MGERRETCTVSPERWVSPYCVDTEYPYHLVNDQGRHLFILGKTAWTYFVCKDPEGVCRRAKEQGVTVLRVTLNGAPYYDVLGHDCWPWRGSSAVPDYSGIDTLYFEEVCRRARLACSYGLGLDVVLYMRKPLPSVGDIGRERIYWEHVLATVGREPNAFCWEIANETLSEYGFQEVVGTYFASEDPWNRPVCTSDGTTDYVAWPHAPFIDLAINHTCTGRRSLDAWYRAVAMNARMHGKPAWCNESGREVRHRNDDGVHRRKQGWVWYASGCYWTHHSWDGCEGIDDSAYRAPGQEFLSPMAGFWQSLDWWRLSPCFSLIMDKGEVPLAYALQSPVPERDLAVIYMVTEETGRKVVATSLDLLLLEGEYSLTYYQPASGAVLTTSAVSGQGLDRATRVPVPAFRDDLALVIRRQSHGEREIMSGTG